MTRRSRWRTAARSRSPASPLEVLHAPGHSRGSVCLYCEELDAVFTGDVVTETRAGGARGRLPELGPSARRDRRPDADAARPRPGCCPATATSSRWRSRRSASTRWVAAGQDADAAECRLPGAPLGSGLGGGWRLPPDRARMAGWNSSASTACRDGCTACTPDPAEHLARLPAPVPDDLPGPAAAAQGPAVGPQQPRRERAQRAGRLVAAAAPGAHRRPRPVTCWSPAG